MSNIKETIEVRDKTYILNCEVSKFKHLCTFYELSNLALTITYEDAMFSTSVVQNNNFTEHDYKIFRLLLQKVAKNNSAKGFLISYGTGSVVGWHYMANQAKILTPFFEILPITDRYVLYHDTDTKYNIRVPGREIGRAHV